MLHTADLNKTTFQDLDPIDLAKVFTLVAEEIIQRNLLSPSYRVQLRSMRTNLQRTAFNQALDRKE